MCKNLCAHVLQHRNRIWWWSRETWWSCVKINSFQVLIDTWEFTWGCCIHSLWKVLDTDKTQGMLSVLNRQLGQNKRIKQDKFTSDLVKWAVEGGCGLCKQGFCLFLNRYFNILRDYKWLCKKTMFSCVIRLYHIYVCLWCLCVFCVCEWPCTVGLIRHCESSHFLHPF